MDAQRSLDSLLGRLTSILVEEAQLLGSVRGDVEFIKDEMESMNGLLLHLTEAQHRDHQVRAWMKQVVGLTRDCEGNVELYIHYVDSGPGGGGVLGRLRQVARFLRTIPVRHRIATRIQELKVRARDVGDRRQRYGVTVPTASAMAVTDMNDGDIEPIGDEEVRRRRRAILLDSAHPPAVADQEELVRKCTDYLIKLLKREPAPATAAARDDDGQQVRVFYIRGSDLADTIAKRVYQDPTVATSFSCKSMVHTRDLKNARATLAKILEEIISKEGEHSTEEPSVDEDVDQLASELQQHLKGNDFLIVISIDSWKSGEERKRLVDALFHAVDGCHPGSAIMIITEFSQVTQSCSPYKILNVTKPLPAYRFYTCMAEKLGARHTYHVARNTGTVYNVFDICTPSAFAMKMLLHLLYVNPDRTDEEMRKYLDAISECRRLNKSLSKQTLIFCYNELPIKYRSCLLYLTVYPQGYVIRTTSLSRRWVADGLITTAANHGKQSALTDEADHHLDVLFTRGFVTPVEINPGGDIKSFTLHSEVREVLTKIARDVNFVETSQQTQLSHHLSIHNRIALRNSHSEGDSIGIVASLPSLAASPQWQLLKVLDLEGCQGLDKHHLKSICKILLLKYLSLRGTDVIELPKQIQELQCLETLDIRETKVRMLAKKPIVLRLLKHFLAGHKVSAGKDMTSEESFATVRMPLGIQKMRNIEILSHVQVTNKDSELSCIAQLLKLRKLGVALRGKNVKLSDLFFQIEELHKCLRSLSIRIVGAAGAEGAGEVDALPSIPEFIERLNICGITSGLVHSIQDRHQLAKITLTDTNLNEDDLSILGNLGGLRCLRLQHKSYTGSELAFRKFEFKSLNYLLVEGKDITKIRFAIGAAPKLERIVWTFATMDTLSGIDWLPSLKKVELNGDCDLGPIKEALEGHPNNAILEHKPCQQR